MDQLLDPDCDIVVQFSPLNVGNIQGCAGGRGGGGISAVAYTTYPVREVVPPLCVNTVTTKMYVLLYACV